MRTPTKVSERGESMMRERGREGTRGEGMRGAEVNPNMPSSQIESPIRPRRT